MLVYFSGDWGVHWGFDLDFDPHPRVKSLGHQVDAKVLKSSVGAAVLPKADGQAG